MIDVSKLSLDRRYSSLTFKGFSELLNRELPDAERVEAELARQVKYNELRAELWKISADKNHSGQELIKRLLQLIGNAFDVCKVTYDEYNEEAKVYETVVRWLKSGCKHQESVTVPRAVVNNYLGRTHAVFPQDALPEDREAIQELMAVSGDKSNLIVPFLDSSPEVTRFVSFCDQNTVRVWNEFDLSILKELVNIASQQIKYKTIDSDLEYSIHKFQTYVRNTNNVFFTLSADGIFTDVSPTWTDILGHSCAEIIGRPFSDFVHPSDIKGAWIIINKLLKTGVKQSGGAFRVQNKQGVWKWYTTNSALLVNEADQSRSFLGVAYDVTERMETERLLKKERQHFYDLIEHTPITIVELGKNGVIKFINQRAEKELEYRRSELLSSHFLDNRFISPGDKPKLKAAFERLLAGEEIQALEIMARTRSGKELHLEIHAIPMESRILAVIANVTESKTASEKLKKGYDELEMQIQKRTQQLQEKNHELNLEIKERRKIEEELRESQQKLNLIIDTIPQFIFWKDRNSIYHGCNRNFAKAAGVNSPEEIVGKSDFDLAWTKKQSDHFVTCDQRVMSTNTPEYHIIEQQRQADGNTVWLSTSKVPLCNQEKKVIGILGAYEDITAELAAQKQEKIREQQLVQADKMISLGILVSGIAHEINNPNQFIMSHITPLKRMFEDALPILEKYYDEFGDFKTGGINFSRLKAQAPKIFSNLISGTQRIKTIVEELREYISEYPSEHSETIQFNSVVESALTLLENLIKKSTTSFTVSFADNLPFIKGHYQRLEQVIINLVQNACQALTSKHESIHIRTKLDGEDQLIVFTVSDEGVGIPAEYRNRVTDLFFTTKRDTGGIGLGLAISAKIVAEHAGKLSFAPGEKKGTVATLSIPLDRNQQTTTRKPFSGNPFL